jgi:hypothetical protein
VSYYYNLPYSVMLRRPGPAFMRYPPLPIKSIDEELGAFVDAAGVSVTTGNPAWDRIIKWGFWIGLGALTYQAYRSLRYGEPFFGGDGGVPPAWEANPYPRDEGRPTFAYEEALLLYEPGANVAAIARDLELPYDELMHFLKEQGVYVSRELLRKKHQQWRTFEILGSPELREEIVSLAASGMRIRELAHHFAAPEAVIEKVLKQAGIPFDRWGLVDPEHPLSRERAKRSKAAKMGQIKKRMYRRNPEHMQASDKPELERVCSWCKRWLVEGQWVEAKPPEGMLITHGICEACFERIQAEQFDGNPEEYERIRCAFCGGPWHPASGMLVGSPAEFPACGRCFRELLEQMKETFGREIRVSTRAREEWKDLPRKERGPRPWISFYEHAVGSIGAKRRSNPMRRI